MSFHYNDDTDKVGRCTARPGFCPLRTIDGTSPEHYKTADEARAAADSKLAAIYDTFGTDSRPQKPIGPSPLRKKLMAVGGVLLASYGMVSASNIAANAAPPAQAGFFDDAQAQLDSLFGGKDAKMVDELSGGELDRAKKEASDMLSSLGSIFGESKSGKSSIDLGDSTQLEVGQSAEGVFFQGKPIKPSASEIADAKQKLAELNVAAKGSGKGYKRAEQFGRSFQTGVVGRIEHRDVTNGIFKNAQPQSRAVGGDFIDPYTGDTVEVVKGSTADTNVEHIVSLSDAYKSGMRDRSQEDRLSIANDPDNLQIVGAKVNKEKSDKTAADWLPSYEPGRIRVAMAQINVKHKYNLTVDSREFAALSAELNRY